MAEVDSEKPTGVSVTLHGHSADTRGRNRIRDNTNMKAGVRTSVLILYVYKAKYSPHPASPCSLKLINPKRQRFHNDSNFYEVHKINYHITHGL